MADGVAQGLRLDADPEPVSALGYWLLGVGSVDVVGICLEFYWLVGPHEDKR